MARWLELFFEYLLECIGPIDEASFVAKLIGATRKEKAQAAKRLRRFVLITGGSWADAREARETVMDDDVTEEEAKELYKQIANWRASQE